MKKFNRTFIEKIQDFFFRMIITLFFKRFEGRNILYRRTYPKVSEIHNGYLVSKVPGKNVFLAISNVEVYWVKLKDIYFVPNDTSKVVTVEDVPANFKGPMFELTKSKILMRKLNDEVIAQEKVKIYNDHDLEEI